MGARKEKRGKRREISSSKATSSLSKPRANNRMQAVMFVSEPGQLSKEALLVGKRARAYHYQHIEEDTSRNTHAQSNGPRGEQLQQQRATSHHQIGDLEGNRQPECPALPRQQSLCAEKGNNPSQKKNPRQKPSQNSNKSPWCSVTMRDIIDTYEASKKSDQADDDQE